MARTVNPLGYSNATRVTTIAGKTYICTCPDYQKRFEGNPFSPSRSLRVPSSWLDSSRGARGDCKHLMAVKTQLGIPNTFTDEETGAILPFPNDLPDA